jgi:hypothetical protein
MEPPADQNNGLTRLLYLLKEEFLEDRPLTRGECADFERPCPYIGCRYHLFMDYTTRGVPDSLWWSRDPLRMDQTCCLDIADAGPITLEEVGEMLGLTRERVRQIETMAMLRVQDRFDEMGLDFHTMRDLLREWDSQRAWKDHDRTMTSSRHGGNGKVIDPGSGGETNEVVGFDRDSEADIHDEVGQ